MVNPSFAIINQLSHDQSLKWPTANWPENKIELNDEDFNKITANTLVMTGEYDIGSTVKMSQELNALISKSQLKIIKDGKHLCGIECADDVNLTIKNFIGSDE